MKTVFVSFKNHFDLVWRRCWDRATLYQGARYLSYREVQEQILARVLDMAEQGRAAYAVEQTLTLRAYLKRHPRELQRIRSLAARGLLEVFGAGEAIIDVNMCSLETMARNMASGVRYSRDVLHAAPHLANHNDGFGSSAQFPQIIRGCGFRGIHGLSYSKPEKPYWKGLDGSVIFVHPGEPGRRYFFDHCYHEPCRACRGLASKGCSACAGSGIDLPQNAYPAFAPLRGEEIPGEHALYTVSSEEMLPPETLGDALSQWMKDNPEVRYRWGTPGHLRDLQEEALRRVNNPPPESVAARVENNPVQTGCLVSRIGIKQAARAGEARFYAWEKALALTCASALDREGWETLWLEWPLVYFHDAITGTHQDDACRELADRMEALGRGTDAAAAAALRQAGYEVSLPPARLMDGTRLQVFAPHAHAAPARIPIRIADWREGAPAVAVDAAGRRWPVIRELHALSPAMPPAEQRLVAATGPGARTRPGTSRAMIETVLPPLAWTSLEIRTAEAPRPLAGKTCETETLKIEWDDRGPTQIRATVSGKAAQADDAFRIGELFVEEDVGDPWGTRQIPSFRRPLGPYTHHLGGLRFEGYRELYFAGRYEPNLRFGREEDPSIFALDWYVTVRILDDFARVDFQYEIFWKSVNRRLRAVFPVQAATDAGFYSIPGGWLRRERYDQTETFLWSPNGDWPALYAFASAPDDAGRGWGLVNYGTPSARIEDGRLLVSLLRSPGFGHCLERYAQQYPMPTSGIRDGGWHLFTVSLVPYAGGHGMTPCNLDALALNEAPPCVTGTDLPTGPLLQIEGGGIELAAVKPAFDNAHPASRIIRLVNHLDERSQAVLNFGGKPPATVSECNLLEDPGETLPAPEGRLELDFKPFQVRTLRVDP